MNFWNAGIVRLQTIFHSKVQMYNMQNLTDPSYGYKFSMMFLLWFNAKSTTSPRWDRASFLGTMLTSTLGSKCVLLKDTTWGLELPSDTITSQSHSIPLCFRINPFVTNGLALHYHLGESTFSFRDIRSDFNYIFQ